MIQDKQICYLDRTIAKRVPSMQNQIAYRGGMDHFLIMVNTHVVHLDEMYLVFSNTFGPSLLASSDPVLCSSSIKTSTSG